MGWDERTLEVTGAFDEWKWTDTDIRSFLALTSRWMTERYERVWDELARSPGYDDAPELPDQFHAAVGGLWPHDHAWMLHAAVLRDAVTAFEVYLEKSAAEVLYVHQLQWNVRPGHSPKWGAVCQFYRTVLGVDVESDRVKHIRDLRHILTHLRGELRTKQQRERFGTTEDDSLPHFSAQLSTPAVIAMLDDLGAVVRRIDREVWPAISGRIRLQKLTQRDADHLMADDQMASP